MSDGGCGLLEEVVLVHLAHHVELGGIEASVAGAHHVRAQHARRKDALARVGKHEVVVDALRELEVVVSQRVRVHVKATRHGQRVARIGKPLVKDGYELFHDGYQSTLLEVLRGPAFSLSVWRTRVTELVSDLRLSSRCANTVSAYSSAL